jgi:hypothetical protein
MSRTRLVGAAFLFLTVLPGCGILCGDRSRLCERWRGRGEAYPASMPMGEGCGGMVIPPGGGAGGPIMIGPGGYPYGGETFPHPMNGAPNIPKAGIIESPGERKGTQFDPDKASRTGPVLMIPANGAKGN